MKQPPRVRLQLGEAGGAERHVYVDVLDDEGPGSERSIGYLLVPAEAVPQLGALGILVGLQVFSSLEIAGDGAPPVLALEPRTIRLLKIAAKVLA